MLADIVRAAESGDVEAVKRCLAAGVSPDTRDADDRTPLYAAAGRGHVDVMQSLLEAGAQVNATSRLGTALRAAFVQEEFAAAKLLVEDWLADMTVPNTMGYTLLHEQAVQGSTGNVKFLIDQGLDVDVEDDLGWTPLHGAASCGRLDMVEFLLDCGAKPDVANEDGELPIDQAARSGHEQIVSLLGRSGGDPDGSYSQRTGGTGAAGAGSARDEKDLMIEAFSYAQYGQARKFARHLARDPNLVTMRFGRNPILCVVARSGHTEIIQMLLSKGAPLAPGEMTGRDHDGRYFDVAYDEGGDTAYDNAGAYGHRELAAFLSRAERLRGEERRQFAREALLKTRAARKHAERIAAQAERQRDRTGDTECLPIVIAERAAWAEPANLELQAVLAQSHRKRGDLRYAGGNRDGAEESYRASLAIRKELVKKNRNRADWWRDLSVSYNKVGDMLSAGGDFPAAEESFREALTIRLRLVAEDPQDADRQRDLAASYHRIGDVRLSRNDLAGAEEGYGASLAARDRATALQPGTADS